MTKALRKAISLQKTARRTKWLTTVRIVGRGKWLGVRQLESQDNHPVRRSFMFHYRCFGSGY